MSTLYRRIPAIWLSLVMMLASHAAGSTVTSHAAFLRQPETAIVSSRESGIREFIPEKYLKKYLRWKGEYLSTAAGREQWETYNQNPNFSLTITVSTSPGQGGLIGGFIWDEAGRLVGATMFLGNKLDSGYPDMEYYPVTGSLADAKLPHNINGLILAATKIAHEFGHLDGLMKTDGAQYQLQNAEIIEWNLIFFANRYKVDDPRLIELAGRIGGVPCAISQDREFAAEISAIRYLRERLANHLHGKAPRSVKRAIDAYILTYAKRCLAPAPPDLATRAHDLCARLPPEAVFAIIENN